MLTSEKLTLNSTPSALTEQQLKFLRKYAGKVDNVKYRNGKKYYTQFLKQTQTPAGYDEYIKNLLKLNYIHRTLKISSVKYYRDIRQILGGRPDDHLRASGKFEETKTVDEVVQALKEIIQANSRRSSQAVQNQENQQVIQIIEMDSPSVKKSLAKNYGTKMIEQADLYCKQTGKIKRNFNNQFKKEPRTADFYKSFQTSLGEVFQKNQNQQQGQSSVKYEIRSSEFRCLKSEKGTAQRQRQYQAIKSDRAYALHSEPVKGEQQIFVVSPKTYQKQTKLQDLQQNFLYRKHHHKVQLKKEIVTQKPKKQAILQAKSKIKSSKSKRIRTQLTLSICNKVIQFITSLFFSSRSSDNKNSFLPQKQEENQHLVQKEKNKVQGKNKYCKSAYP